jgi:hypothetical protein
LSLIPELIALLFLSFNVEYEISLVLPLPLGFPSLRSSLFPRGCPRGRILSDFERRELYYIIAQFLVWVLTVVRVPMILDL